MARSRANSSDQPVPEKGTFGLLRALGSLRLAVVLIATFTVLLVWATFVENRYGVEAVKFGIYGTWWFATLGALLALNIFSAALVRFPWKKQQTGFLTTHLGLLVMAAGFLLSRTGGIDANLPIFEGRANWRAFEDSQHFALSILAGEDSNAADSHAAASESIIVPFASGPFNWEDYAALPPFPWWLAIRDRGVPQVTRFLHRSKCRSMLCRRAFPRNGAKASPCPSPCLDLDLKIPSKLNTE